jgi:hypothetical protein
VNLPVCFIVVASLLGMCSSSNLDRNMKLSDQMIEYQLDGGQYAVVVVMDGISASDAKMMARQRAAEIVAQQGDRYFTIDSEQETQVVKSDDDLNNNQRFYGNMYQELIIEKDFGRESRGVSATPITRSYPAIRIVFTSYKTKPNFKAIDACSMTKCN